MRWAIVHQGWVPSLVFSIRALSLADVVLLLCQHASQASISHYAALRCALCCVARQHYSLVLAYTCSNLLELAADSSGWRHPQCQGSSVLILAFHSMLVINYIITVIISLKHFVIMFRCLDENVAVVIDSMQRIIRPTLNNVWLYRLQDVAYTIQFSLYL